MMELFCCTAVVQTCDRPKGWDLSSARQDICGASTTSGLKGCKTFAPVRQETEMNWDQVEGKWKEMSGSVKSKWGALTDDDVAKINGNRQELEGKIQSKYGKTKEEAKAEVNAFIDGL
jgi:uncharacterized protein YjbJ (UPF0337 family)